MIKSQICNALQAFGDATADIQDMYVDSGGREMVPFLEVLDGMVKRGIEVRLIHAKDPDSPVPKASGCPKERDAPAP